MGFKWFVDGLLDGSFGFAGEESAGASFLRRDGSVWTTDKDGIIPGLLAAEITARTGRDPGETFNDLTRELGVPFYARIDAPATAEQKALLKSLSPDRLGMQELAGEPIRATLSECLRAMALRSAGSRWLPTMAGSPRGRPAPRRFIRSMPRVSAAKTTCGRSSKPRKTLSRACFRRRHEVLGCYATRRRRE